MKNRRIILFALIICCIISWGIFCFSKIDMGNSQKKVHDLVAVEPVIDEEDLLSRKELKKEIIEKDVIKEKRNGISQYFYIESELGKEAEIVEYEYDLQDDVIAANYTFDDKLLRFVWEYHQGDAYEYLSNTIRQLSLCELYPDSGLYTYSNWTKKKNEVTDIYWADNDYSYVANIPVEMLSSNVDFVIDFCKSEKVCINSKT